MVAGSGERAAVEVDGLVVRYGRGPGRPAVDGLSLSAGFGEVLCILGPNGAGKTSTVECLEGYRRPTGGRVRVLGLDPLADHRALVPRLGVMLQRGGVYPMLGPRRALHLFAAYYERPEDPEALLELVGLSDVAATPWRHLSGGEQARLSLALALVGRPEVVCLDEPTAGVDPEGRLGVRRVITELRDRGVCVLLTTHELGEAEKLADRVVILHHGRAVAEGSPATLAAEAGGTAQVTFGAPGGLDVGALSAAVGATVTEEGRGRYRVAATASPSLTAALAAWLAERDATLTDLRAGQSLEDAYLSVVGAEALAEPVADDAPRRRGGRGGPAGRAGRSGGRERRGGGRRRRGASGGGGQGLRPDPRDVDEPAAGAPVEEIRR